VADSWRCDARFGDGCVTISGPENVNARKWYEKHEIPVFAYSSLARGFFSGAFSSASPEDAKKIMDEPGIIGYYCENNIERLRRCEILAEKRVSVLRKLLWHGFSVSSLMFLRSPARLPENRFFRILMQSILNLQGMSLAG